jgi:hypothetical protein
MQGDLLLANLLLPKGLPKGHLDPYAVEAAIVAVPPSLLLPAPLIPPPLGKK